MPVIVNAIPKSGTNMLCRVIDLIGFGRCGNKDIIPKLAISFPGLIEYDENGRFIHPMNEVPLAASILGTISKEEFLSRVERLFTLPDDAYIEAHMLHSDYAAEILAERKIKMIIIMRDHRAVALSHADWILESPQNRFYPMMMSLSLRERLAYEYNGTPGNWAEVKTPLIPIIARYRTMLPWRHYPHVHVTTFESLVGAKGGGSPGSQLREVERIFKFLNRDEQALDAVREGLWGNSSTFRNGQAWRWRQYVDDFPTAAFEQGPELAEFVNYMSAPDL